MSDRRDRDRDRDRSRNRDGARRQRSRSPVERRRDDNAPPERERESNEDYYARKERERKAARRRDHTTTSGRREDNEDDDEGRRKRSRSRSPPRRGNRNSDRIPSSAPSRPLESTNMQAGGTNDPANPLPVSVSDSGGLPPGPPLTTVTTTTRAAPSRPAPVLEMIEVIANDRLGGKVRVKCSPDDTVGDLKKLIAAQKGTKPEKIVLKKWYNIFKDHITLRDYEIHHGMSLEMN